MIEFILWLSGCMACIALAWYASCRITEASHEEDKEGDLINKLRDGGAL